MARPESSEDASLEQALDRARRSERLLELFLEHAPDIVTVLEPDLTQRSVAGAVEQVLGYPRSEIATSGFSYVHPDDVPGLGERAALLLQDSAAWLPSYRYRVRHADGSWRWVESTTSDLRETELEGFLTFTRDVTEHEEQSRANAEARARIEALVSSLHDPVLLVDGAGVVFIANPAYLHLTELEEGDVIGLPEDELWELARPLFRSSAEFERHARESVESGSPMRGEELALADGRLLEVEHIPVRVDGALVGRVWAMRDVTAERESRARAEEQIAELERLDDMRERLVSTVSHELRTPLTSILSHLQLLLDEEAGLDAENLHAVQAAERNAKRLRRLVDDLLDVQRIDQGAAVFAFSEVDLGELVREQVDGMHAFAAGSGIELVQSARTGCTAAADDGRMRQVVDNLLANAIRYTPSGGRVEARTRMEHDHVLIEVEDTGVGIADADRLHVFEPFFRAGDEASVEGTGLGLAIARGIVEAHGGTIGCRSEVGVGTTFWVRVPRLEPER